MVFQRSHDHLIGIVLSHRKNPKHDTGVSAWDFESPRAEVSGGEVFAQP